jgi:alkylation response protein AidB-like acyl-CoA dehydrogenase
MDEMLSTNLIKLRTIVEDVTREVIAPKSALVDRDCLWPQHSMQALADAGLMGLHVPKRLGGHEQGLLALAVISETIARGCSSSALCYAMHCVGSAVITSKATKYHEERYLRPIAAGQHITTLALSEAGTGVHFYLPRTHLEQNKDHFTMSGSKHFVTNGGQADSYVISTRASTSEAETGDFNCLVVDAGTDGMTWLPSPEQIGFTTTVGRRADLFRCPRRGDSSRTVRVRDRRSSSSRLVRVGEVRRRSVG